VPVLSTFSNALQNSSYNSDIFNILSLPPYTNKSALRDALLYL